MVMDGPVIDYGTGKKKGMGNSRADVAEMEALAEAYAKRKASSGGMTGKTMKLDDFVKGRV